MHPKTTYQDFRKRQRHKIKKRTPAFTVVNGVNVVHHCTAQSLLVTLPTASIDLIITDPPYGIRYRAGWKTTNGGKHRRVAAAFGPDNLQLDWIPDAYRALKTNGALYLFSRWDVIHIWREALEAAGFRVIQRIIWDKMHWGGGNLNYYGSQTEDILFCVKGNHKLRNWKRDGNIWQLTKLDCINNEGNLDNPTQKPERLIRKMILNSSDPDQIILDPFCGTGTTGAAAYRAGRRYIMADCDQKQFAIAKQRLESLSCPILYDDLPLFYGIR